MFKLFKRNRKLECYGDKFKFSVKCHSCTLKESCLDHINSKLSGKFCIPSDKPLPKPPPSLESKTPPKPNWTLEAAQEDFMKKNKTCKNCRFMKWDWFPVTEYRDRDIMVCQVKQQETSNDYAEKCKYYTIN